MPKIIPIQVLNEFQAFEIDPLEDKLMISPHDHFYEFMTNGIALSASKDYFDINCYKLSISITFDKGMKCSFLPSTVLHKGWQNEKKETAIQCKFRLDPIKKTKSSTHINRAFPAKAHTHTHTNFQCKRWD